jgi:hypothetical protein
MPNTIGLLISGALALTGAVGAISPGTLCRLDSDTPPGPLTSDRLRTMRISGIVMLVLACAVAYAVCTAKGVPEGPLF